MKKIGYIFIVSCLLFGCSYKKVNSDISEEYAYESLVLTQDIETYDDTTLLVLMEDIMQTYGLNEENFAISYENLVTHQSYEFNESTLMLGASTVKVPINMLYYDRKYDIENTYLVYEYQDYEEGGGFTAATYSVGDLVPLSYVMEQSIVYSDNTAINIMLDSIGVTAFKEYFASFTNVLYDDQFYYENLTSAELLHEVSVQLYEQSDQYATLIADMKEAMPDRYMKTLLDGVEVAHKYGQYDSYEHDFGIVYASQPFSLSILTNHVEDAEELIAVITYTLYEYQENQQ